MVARSNGGSTEMGKMQESDLTPYYCPELFVRFKLALVTAQQQRQGIAFIVARQQQESIRDIQRFLTAKALTYSVIELKENVKITVEIESSV